MFKRAKAPVIGERNKRLAKMATGDLAMYAETSIMNTGRAFDTYMRDGNSVSLDQAHTYINECSDIFLELQLREGLFHGT